MSTDDCMDGDHIGGDHIDKELAIELRRRQVWDLVKFRGFTQREAAREVGVSKTQVVRDLDAFEAEEAAAWRSKAMGMADCHAVKYYGMAAEVLGEWRKSIGRIEEIVKHKDSDKDGNSEERIRKAMLGAIEYVREWRSLHQAAEKLIPGTIAPVKQEVDIAVIDRLVQADLDRATAHMTPEQAVAYLAEVASGDGGE